MIRDDRYEKFLAKKDAIEAEKLRLASTFLKPTAEVQEMIRSIGGSELKDGIRASDLLKRPEMSYDQLEMIFPSEVPLDEDVKEQVEIQLKYEGYISKSLQQVDRLKKMEDKKIPENIDYDFVSGLATEARQKLKLVKPLSIAQASRISGVNPADVSILLVYLEQGKIARVSNE